MTNDLCVFSGTTNQREKRSVADECCSRPCSRNYMKINFCQEPEE